MGYLGCLVAFGRVFIPGSVNMKHMKPFFTSRLVSVYDIYQYSN